MLHGVEQERGTRSVTSVDDDEGRDAGFYECVSQSDSEKRQDFQYRCVAVKDQAKSGDGGGQVRL